MVRAQFLNTTDLKNFSVIEQNVDDKKLNLAIREFQELEIKPLLGTEEYLRLENVVIAATRVLNPVAITPEDKELFDHIRPVMIYGSVMYSINPVNNRFSNTGTKNDNDQYSQSGDSAGARADAAFKMEGYKRELRAFLAQRDTNTIKVCADQGDTSFAFTGISLPDATRDDERIYENRYYKYGGFGRYER